MQYVLQPPALWALPPTPQSLLLASQPRQQLPPGSRVPSIASTIHWSIFLHEYAPPPPGFPCLCIFVRAICLAARGRFLAGYLCSLCSKDDTSLVLLLWQCGSHSANECASLAECYIWYQGSIHSLASMQRAAVPMLVPVLLLVSHLYSWSRHLSGMFRSNNSSSSICRRITASDTMRLLSPYSSAVVRLGTVPATIPNLPVAAVPPTEESAQLNSSSYQLPWYPHLSRMPWHGCFIQHPKAIRLSEVRLPGYW